MTWQAALLPCLLLLLLLASLLLLLLLAPSSWQAALLPCLVLLLLASLLLPNMETPVARRRPLYLVAGKNLSRPQDLDPATCFSPALSDSPVPSLAAVAALPPPAPPNSSCSAPALPSPPSCVDTAFTGRLLKTPSKIVHMILFAFEVDTLEIQLREASDVVDHYILVEATRTHKGEEKPLMWERIRFTDRFSFLKPGQVIHVVVDHLGDDVVHKANAKGVDWWFESEQTSAGLARVRSWAAALSSRLQDSDVFIHGNTDEVLGRLAVHSLAHCELAGNTASGALWMPMGNPAHALRTYHPVKNRPHSICMPAIYTWGRVREGGEGGHHFKGRKDRYVLGGVHLTNPSFLPNALLKEVSGTEYSSKIPGFFNRNHDLAELDRQQARIFGLENKSFWRSRVSPASSVTDVSTSLPWWLACHPLRYPYWFGRPDPRNTQLLEAMVAGPGEGGAFRVADVII